MKEREYRASMKFPKRFELEGLNPRQVRVKIVVLAGDMWITKEFSNLAAISADVGLMQLCGPFADKDSKGNWCLRFENKAACTALSE